MHRRQLIRSVAGALMVPPAAALARQREVSDATPATMPQHHGLPRPIVLGDGIELIDYRIYPSPDVPRIIGEITSTRDEMVDSPVISMTFPDLDTDAFAWAPPHLPVMRPGESNLIFGVLPEQVDSEEKLATAEFDLCGPVEPGEYSLRLQGSDLRATIDTESYWADSLNVVGKVHNAGEATVSYSMVYGMVRDRNGRYIGVTADSATGDMGPGATHDFFLWASTLNSSPANAYALLNGSTDYVVDAVPSTLKPFTTPGCPAFFPWNQSAG